MAYRFPHEETTPLDLVGGFEEYQRWMYDKVRDKIISLARKESGIDFLKAIEKRLENDGKLVDGLEGGIGGFLKERRYLTNANLTALDEEPVLDFYRKAIGFHLNIPPGQTEYWKEQAEKWQEEHPTIPRRDLFYWVIGLESDRNIRERSKVV